MMNELDEHNGGTRKACQDAHARMHASRAELVSTGLELRRDGLRRELLREEARLADGALEALLARLGALGLLAGLLGRSGLRLRQSDARRQAAHEEGVAVVHDLLRTGEPTTATTAASRERMGIKR